MALLPATAPTIVPPSQLATYDGWFLSGLNVSGMDPANVNGTATLRKARQNADGSIDFCPTGESVVVNLSNLLGSADVNVQAAVAAVMAAVASQAAVQGIKL